MVKKQILFVSGVVALLVIAAIGLTGCQTLGAYVPSTVGHPVVGVWEYQNETQMHRREFTVDGKCIMYRGREMVSKDGKPIEYSDDGESYLIYDFDVLNGNTVVVIKKDHRGKERLLFEVLADGRLSCESKYIAYRVR